MKKYRVASLLVFAVLFAGCARAPEVTLNLNVGTQDSAVLEEVRRILLYRFDEVRSSFLSSVESEIDGQVISFRFKGGAPESSLLRYLYETPGKVRTSLVESSAVLFTDRDIEKAALAYENESSVIRLRLTPTAGERVLALTTRNIGNTVRMTLDGRRLLDATISGAFSDSFQITSPDQDTEKSMALVVVLRSGALPASVSLLQPKNGI